MRLLRVSASEGLLRIALAFAFLYPAVDGFFHPTLWLAYFPVFVTSTFHVLSVPLKWSDVVMLHFFAVLELILALWVLFGKRVRIPALVMALALFINVGANLDPTSFAVLFRDVTIAFAALALAVRKRPQTPPQHV